MSFKPLLFLALAVSVAAPADAAMSVGTFLARAAPRRSAPIR